MDQDSSHKQERYPDPVETALDVIGGKWKPLIIWNLKDRTLRYTELQKSIPKVSPRMLTKQLRELEDENVITRKVYPEVPPRVEYTVTELGLATIPILEALYIWGADYLVMRGYKVPMKKGMRNIQREETCSDGQEER
ncbi:winged helix-turn-helix transcriptional regulator [Methanolobus sp. WCC5]|jgi:DNA-binding HxlR family transcriptional regulator|uniref:winged helix-turn-helix transcriptional regulator n=1 Tax=Methanolobus sp. WCC5 TaxID=3125785 RepID=UPI0032568DBF